EVDEEVRRERLKKLFERPQTLIFAVITPILAGVGGWRGYEWWASERAAETGTAFEIAQSLSDEGKHADAEAAFAKIAAEGSADYRSLARLRQPPPLSHRHPHPPLPPHHTTPAPRP